MYIQAAQQNLNRFTSLSLIARPESSQELKGPSELLIEPLKEAYAAIDKSGLFSPADAQAMKDFLTSRAKALNNSESLGDVFELSKQLKTFSMGLNNPEQLKKDFSAANNNTDLGGFIATTMQKSDGDPSKQQILSSIVEASSEIVKKELNTRADAAIVAVRTSLAELLAPGSNEYQQSINSQVIDGLVRRIEQLRNAKPEEAQAVIDILGEFAEVLNNKSKASKAPNANSGDVAPANSEQHPHLGTNLCQILARSDNPKFIVWSAGEAIK